MSSHGTFATAINCMDGRTQLPVNSWAKKQFRVDFVDTITEPGPDKILATGSGELLGSIKNRVRISVEKHSSKNIVIVAHHDCAGNPVERERHLVDLHRAAENVGRWGLKVTIKKVWVNEEWQVKEIA